MAFTGRLRLVLLGADCGGSQSGGLKFLAWVSLWSVARLRGGFIILALQDGSLFVFVEESYCHPSLVVNAMVSGDDYSSNHGHDGFAVAALALFKLKNLVIVNNVSLIRPS